MLSKFFKLFLLLFLAIPFQAQPPIDSFRLIPPVKVQPPISKNQAQVVSRYQTYRNWGIKVLGFDPFIGKYTGKGLKYCIVDTGQPRHEELLSSIEGGKNFTANKTKYDNNGHSTHIAGVYNEIVYNAKGLYSKTLSNSGSGADGWIAAGCKWCDENGADVINLSLGSSLPSTLIYEALKPFHDRGGIIVAAAGNSGTGGENNMGYPARYDICVAVGAIDQTGKTAYFSSAGNEGDIMAAGQNILSTWLNNEYAILDGTSMATPFVGAIALMYIEKNGTSKGFYDAVVNSAVDIAPDGFDRFSFYGSVNGSMLAFIEEPPKDTVVIDPNPIEEVDPPNDPIEEEQPTFKLPWYSWAITGLLILAALLLFGVFNKNRPKSKD